MSIGRLNRIWENFFSILECHFFFVWSCKSSNRILVSVMVVVNWNFLQIHFLTLLDYANEI